MRHTKAAFVEAKQMDGMERRVFTFRASTNAVDRQGEVVDQSGWELESYRSNPVILDSHKYGSIDDIIGKAVRVEMAPEGLEVDIEFADTAKGQQAEALVDQGFLRTVSVGFRSLGRKPQSAGQPMVHTRSELLEVSLVAIPANREAVRIRQVEEKAGRRLSKRSEQSIRDAIALLVELLDEYVDDSEMESSMPEEEKPKAVEVESVTLAALSRFAKEAK